MGTEAAFTIVYGFTGVAVWLGLSGVYGSSDVSVCLVDDSSGAYVGWLRVRMCV